MIWKNRRVQSMVRTPILCACGKQAHPQYGSKCEDCWVLAYSRCTTELYQKNDAGGNLSQEVDLSIELISELDLPLIVINSLERAGITEIDELTEKSISQLLKIRGIGEKALSDIRKGLDRIGLELNGD